MTRTEKETIFKIAFNTVQNTDKLDIKSEHFKIGCARIYALANLISQLGLLDEYAEYAKAQHCQ